MHIKKKTSNFVKIFIIITLKKTNNYNKLLKSLVHSRCIVSYPWLFEAIRPEYWLYPGISESLISL